MGGWVYEFVDGHFDLRLVVAMVSADGHDDRRALFSGRSVCALYPALYVCIITRTDIL